MGGVSGHPFELNPPPHHHFSAPDHRRKIHQQHPIFSDGTLVEVEVNEEGEQGCKGVYFSATVIPDSRVLHRKKGTRKGKIYVEYHDLLAEGESSARLQEQVKVSSLRPAPPREIVEGFELNDVVDAFYNDGWWKGVVTRVIEEDRKFVVTFESPPDEQAFGFADLRVHWDWRNGSWVRKVNESTAAAMFDIGRKVEVSCCYEDNMHTWYPATIQEASSNGFYLVEYNCPKTGDEAHLRKTTIDSVHIRPCPPLFEDKDFGLLEEVDGFFASHWSTGIISKVLADSRYAVFFKSMPMKEDREFHKSELRSPMEWKDRKWFTKFQLSKDIDSLSQPSKKLKEGNLSKDISDSLSQPSKKLKEGNVLQPCQPADQLAFIPYSRTKKARTKVAENSLSLEKNGTPSLQLESQEPNNGGREANEIGNVDKEVINEPVKEAAEKCIIPVPAEGGNSKLKGKRGRPSSIKEIAELVNDHRQRQQQQQQPNGLAIENVKKIDKSASIKNSQKRKRGRPTKLTINNSPHTPANGSARNKEAASNKCVRKDVNLHQTRESVVVIGLEASFPNQKFTSNEKNVELTNDPNPNRDSLRESEVNRMELDQTVEAVKKVVTEAPHKEFDDEPLSTWIEGMPRKKSTTQCSEPQNLPFVKKLDFWNTIESMKVFKRVPQNPHFEPLGQVDESLREGIAIGHMLNFSSVVEKAFKLKLNDPISITDGILDDFERHGFDVGVVRERVAEIASLKSKQEKLVEEANALNNRRLEKIKVDDEVAKLQENVARLQEKLALATAAREKEDREIAILQSSLEKIKESVKVAEYEFEKEATLFL